jgi:hypothetical protein
MLSNTKSNGFTQSTSPAADDGQVALFSHFTAFCEKGIVQRYDRQ